MNHTITRHTLLWALTTVAACGNVTAPDPMTGDVPDAGPADPTTDPTPTDPSAITILPTQIADERGDVIEFSTGEPVHRHAGPVVALGGAGCPEVYKYGYLLDREPGFGRQVTQNALAWAIQAPTASPLDDAASAYRVVTSEGEVLLGWTSIGAPTVDGRYAVTLYRDDVPELGSYAGELHLDVRFRDQAGTEQVATACWNHHPLAAPLVVEPPQRAATTTALFGMSLAGDSNLSDLIGDLSVRQVDVLEQRFVQQTAEPITLGVAVSTPAGSYATTVIDEYEQTATSSVDKSCETDPAYCDQSPLPNPPDLVRAGAITRGLWQFRIVDAVTGVPLSCGGLANTPCTIPGRGLGEAPHGYRIIVSARGFSDLWPAAASPGQLTLAGLTFTGTLVTAHKQVRCTFLKGHTAPTGETLYACLDWVEYTEMLALDRARLELSPVTVQLSSAAGAGALEPLPYPGGALASPAVSWDGGDDDLPGPN